MSGEGQGKGFDMSLRRGAISTRKGQYHSADIAPFLPFGFAHHNPLNEKAKEFFLAVGLDTAEGAGKLAQRGSYLDTVDGGTFYPRRSTEAVPIERDRIKLE